MTSEQGPALVVVATPIGNLGDLSPRAVRALADADLIACEDTRRTRKLLSHAGVRAKTLIAVHDHNEAAAVRQLMARLDEGSSVALVTDAGTPSISDPGQRVVAAALTAGHRVIVVPGPSAGIAALVASGLPSDRFVFEGFLPRKGRERTERLAAIAAERRTTIVYESPSRVRSTVGDLLEACGPSRRLALARELTKLHEHVWRGTLATAADHVADEEPRGEHVLVIEGAAKGPAPTDADIEDALAACYDDGDDNRAALPAVAAELQVPKRRVYAAALRIRESGADASGTVGGGGQ